VAQGHPEGGVRLGAVVPGRGHAHRAIGEREEGFADGLTALRWVASNRVGHGAMAAGTPEGNRHQRDRRTLEAPKPTRASIPPRHIVNYETYALATGRLASANLIAVLKPKGLLMIAPSTLIELRRLDNKPVQIPSSAIFRVRPALDSVEPGAVTVVHYDLDDRDPRYNSLASMEDLATVIARIAVALPMIEFSSPSGTIVFLDASKVVGVQQPIKGVHYEGTKAVVHIYTQYQQVGETVSEVGKRVRDALSLPPVAPLVAVADAGPAAKRTRARG
jgi:hypothetical protein